MDTSVRELLTQLQADGLQLWVQDGKLRYRPKGALGAEQLAVLRENRADVLAWLRPQTALAGLSRSAFTPLARGQEGLWFLHELAQGGAYVVGLTARVRGPLDTGILARTIDEVTRRHEILRTRFRERKGAVTQVVMAVQRSCFGVVEPQPSTSSTSSFRLSSIWLTTHCSPFASSKSPTIIICSA
jgi:hypothetical protein